MSRMHPIATPVGTLQAIWNAAGLLQACGFTHQSAEASTAEPPGSRWPWQVRCDQLSAQVQAYFAGQPLAVNLEWLDWSLCTPFQQRVLQACYHIPHGSTLSYAQLAVQVKSPRGARAVGAAMARNPWPIVIPCHRVVGANGQLTGYSGTGGIDTKRRLLAWEAAREPLAAC